MHRPSQGAWGYAYHCIRGVGGPHRRPPAEDMTVPALILSAGSLIVFFALHALATVIPAALILKVAFWSSVVLFFVIGTLHEVLPRWLANALVVVFVAATVSVPMGVIVWLGSLAP
jgi:hypothetical protein